MTSKIVVNNIEADAGVSTVTFGSKISSTEFVGNLTGDVTTSTGNITVGTGVTLNSPSDNVLNIQTNGSTRIRVGSGGSVNVGGSGEDYRFQVTGPPSNGTNYGILHIRDSQTLSGAAGTGGIFLSSSPGTDYYIAKGYDGSSTRLKFGNANNATEYMAIDASGRVTMPYQPGCSVWYSGTDITSGTIVYDEVEFNTGSHYSTSNGRFTAPIAGRYLVLVNHLSNSTSSVGFRLYKNGSPYTAFWGFNDGGTTNKPVHFSVAVSLAESDYLTVVWANGTILGSANYHNAFTVYLLG